MSASCCSSSRATCSRPSISRSASVQPRAGARQRPAVCRAAEPKQSEQQEGVAPPAPSGRPSYVKEYRSNGMRVIETDAPLDGPENQKDFWEGDTMEGFGKFIQTYFLPLLVVLGVVCGGIAAGTYNNDADTFVAPPTSPDDEARIIKMQ